MLWWTLTFAAEPSRACEEGDVAACRAWAAEAAERVLANATDAQPFDPRYTPGLQLAMEHACAAGDRPSCQWTRGTDDPVRLCERFELAFYCPAEAVDPLPSPTLPATLHPGALVPLGDGWVPVSNDAVSQELGTEGRWFPYAERMWGSDGALFVLTPRGQAVRLDADGTQTVDVVGPDEGICDLRIGGHGLLVSVGAPKARRCDRLRHVDLQTGTVRNLGEPMELPRRTRVAGAHVALPHPEWVDKVMRWGPDGTEEVDGVLLDVRSDGALLLRRGEQIVLRLADGTETETDSEFRASLFLVEGGWVEVRHGRIRLVDDDGRERGIAEGRTPSPVRAARHPNGRSWVVAGHGYSLVVGEGDVLASAPDWADPERPVLRPEPPVAAADAIVFVDPEGRPLADAWVGDRRTDADGRVPYPLSGDVVFVDGVPRAATLDDDGRMRVMPLRTVTLPEGLAPRHLLSPWGGWLGDRIGPGTYLWTWPEGPADDIAMVVVTPASPSGSDRVGPGVERVWLKDAGRTDFVEVERTRQSVTDASGRPLPGIDGQVDGPIPHAALMTDAEGVVTHWSDQPFQPAGVDGATVNGDRVVLPGAVAAPVPWPTPPEDLAGPWHAGTEEDRQVLWLVPHRLHPVRPGLAVDGGIGLLYADGRVLDPISMHRYERPLRGRRNNARWFTGRWAWSPGDRATYTVTAEETWGPIARRGVWELAGSSDDLVWAGQRDDGTPTVPMRVVQGVFAGLVDPSKRFEPLEGPGTLSGHQVEERAERTWAQMGGWLSGVRLERGVPTTLHIRQGDLRETIRWVYVERLGCGDGHRCARLTYDTFRGDDVKGSGELLIDPKTLHPYRITHTDPRGGSSETVVTWER